MQKRQLKIIRFTRNDLIESKKNTPLKDISLVHFKGSFREICEADMIFFKDNIFKVLLKTRFPKTRKLPRKLKKCIKKSMAILRVSERILTLNKPLIN